MSELRETVLAAVRAAIREERDGAPWRPLTEVCADTALDWFAARLADPAVVDVVARELVRLTEDDCDGFVPLTAVDIDTLSVGRRHEAAVALAAVTAALTQEGDQ